MLNLMMNGIFNNHDIDSRSSVERNYMCEELPNSLRKVKKCSVGGSLEVFVIAVEPGEQ